MAWYNFRRPHQTLKTTRAVAAGFANEPWSTQRLLSESATATAAVRRQMLAQQKGKRRRLRRTAIAVTAVPAIYVLSYFILGSHTTGESFVLGHPVTGCYTWHDRHYDFDPWLYTPLARLECKLRGRDTQVVIDGSPGRDGSATYTFWSGEPKF